MGYTTKNLREYRMEQGLSMSELSYKAKITQVKYRYLKSKLKTASFNYTKACGGIRQTDYGFH